MLRLIATALLLCVCPGVARGQTIRGTVRDEASGRPIAGAAVFLLDLQGSVRAVARSDAGGAYLLESVAGDTVRVRAERSGYEARESRPWVLGEASVLELELRLQPAPVVLDTLTVSGAWRSRNRAAFERRRRNEIWGRFAGEETLSRVRSPRAVDRLWPVIPGMYVAPDGIVRIRKRGGSLSGVPTCQPRFFIDGTRYPGDVSLDALVQGEAIRAVEFYGEPILAPGEFSMGWDPAVTTGIASRGRDASGYGAVRPCAIIVIWTDVGFAGSTEP